MRQYLRAGGGPTGAYAIVPSTHSSSGGSSGSGSGSGDNLPPHIFAVAQAALANLHCPGTITSSSNRTSNDRNSSIVEPKDQVLVICGESGAGKTETTKLVMQYLAFASTQAAKGRLNSGKSVRTSFNNTFTVLFACSLILICCNTTVLRMPLRSHFVAFCAAFRYLFVFLNLHHSLLLLLSLDEMSRALSSLKVADCLVESSPLLEAFGNAKTRRNDNSSRFGKFTTLEYCLHRSSSNSNSVSNGDDGAGGHRGCIRGAHCANLLLEASRVTAQAHGERNYHVFYQVRCSCAYIYELGALRVFSIISV